VPEAAASLWTPYEGLQPPKKRLCQKQAPQLVSLAQFCRTPAPAPEEESQRQDEASPTISYLQADESLTNHAPASPAEGEQLEEGEQAEGEQAEGEQEEAQSGCSRSTPPPRLRRESSWCLAP